MPRRSVFSDRLLEHRTFAFSDGAEFSQRAAWHAFFSSRIGPTFNRQVILDLGCHEGALLAAVAAAHPTTAFIGMDWKPRSLFHAAEKLHHLPPRPNVALLHARAADLPRLFAPAELSEIWLFHPEPCALPHELPHRLFNPPFLLAAHTALTPSGLLCLKTDHPGYFQHALSLFGLPIPPEFTDPHTPLKLRRRDLASPADLPPPHPALTSLFTPTTIHSDFWSAPPTHPSPRLFAPHTTAYEARFLKKNNPIHYLELRTVPPTSTSQF